MADNTPDWAKGDSSSTTNTSSTPDWAQEGGLNNFEIPPEAPDHGLSERQKLSPIGKALSPFTSYWGNYQRMNGEALQQASEGVQQALHPKENPENPDEFDVTDVAKGVGKAALGTMGYIASPISAAYRSIVGQPIEDVTGIPREYSEFVAQLATPYLGLLGKAPIPKAPLPRPAPPSGPFGVTLTEGEATGDLAARQAEQAALRGQAGKPAQEHAEEFFKTQRPAQLEAAKTQVTQNLDPTGQQVLANTPAEAADIAQQSLQSEAARSKAGVKSLYDQAKALPGEIDSNVFTDMPQNIKTDLSNRPDSVIIDDNTPVATRMINYLDNQIGQLRIKNLAQPQSRALAGTGPAPTVGVNLQGIEQWRKNLSRMRGDALAAYGTNPSDARAANAVINEFDSLIQNAVNSPAFRGDPRAVQLYNDARAAHAERMKVWGNDAIGRKLQAIIGDAAHGRDPASLNDVANFMYSSGGTSPNSLNIGIAKRIKQVLGEDSPEWAAIRQGLFHRLVSTAEGVADRGPGTIANRLSEFLNGKGSDLAGVVFTPDQRRMLNSYADLHNTLRVPQVGANWPNTAAGVIPHVRAVGDRILGFVGAMIGHHIAPFAGEVAGYAAGEQAAKALNKAEEARNLRQIAQQMPLLTQQVRQWQQAVQAQARQQTAVTRARVSLATTNLSAALGRVLNISPEAAYKMITQGPSGPGTSNANEQNKRAKGGRVVASNIDRAPSEKQKEAGNYRKDHVWIQGLDISIENAKGHERSGIGKNGPWKTKMPAHYGYVKGTEGADGDHVDVYVGPHLKSKHVFVINQVDADSKAFDEIKACIGFGSLHQALNTYKKGFSDGKGADRIGSIVTTTIDHFKHWLKHGNTKKPFSGNLN